MSTTVTGLGFNSNEDRLEENGENDDQSRIPNDRLRNIIAYFFLGLCNVLMFDFTIAFQTRSPYHSTIFAFGILIVIMKISPMFLSTFMKTRVIVWIALNAIGTILLVISIVEDYYGYLTGISSLILVLSTGIGEVVILSFSVDFEKHVIAAFSAGQGSAAFLCFLFTKLINTTSEHHTVIWVSLFLLVPIGQAISYYVLLKSKREYVQQSNGITEVNEHELPLTGFIQKVCYIPKILKYIVPLAIMYFLLLTAHQFLYHINKKIVTMDDAINATMSSELSHAHLVSSLGILVGSITVFFLRMQSIWHLVAIQVLNVAYLILEHFFLILASDWILYPLNFWVSFLVGCAYVNTFYKIHEEIHPAKKSFALGISAIATSGGFVLSGFLYIFFKDIVF